MKVKELIEILKKIDEEYTVISPDDMGFPCPVTRKTIELEDLGKTVLIYGIQEECINE